MLVQVDGTLRRVRQGRDPALVGAYPRAAGRNRPTKILRELELERGGTTLCQAAARPPCDRRRDTRWSVKKKGRTSEAESARALGQRSLLSDRPEFPRDVIGGAADRRPTFAPRHDRSRARPCNFDAPPTSNLRPETRSCSSCVGTSDVSEPARPLACRASPESTSSSVPRRAQDARRCLPRRRHGGRGLTERPRCRALGAEWKEGRARWAATSSAP
jgi:hypothetical protein